MIKGTNRYLWLEISYGLLALAGGGGGGGGRGALAPKFYQIFAKSLFFASNFGISMLHVPVSPCTFKFKPPSIACSGKLGTK